MFRKLSLSTTVVVLLAGSLFAGGPPMLTLPIEGVTPDNVSQCKARLAQLLDQPGRFGKVELLEHQKQWYLRDPMDQDVKLSQIETALQGTKFRVPREKLHLFGHVILEVWYCKVPPKGLVPALKAMKHVNVAESKEVKGILHITVDMPYPPMRDRNSLDWVKFERNVFSSTPHAKSEGSATRSDLPTLETFRKVIQNHGGRLEEVRWSMKYLCRPLGGVVESVKKADCKPKSSK